MTSHFEETGIVWNANKSFTVFMFTLVSTALVYIALLILNKLFGPAISWKVTLSYYVKW